jgi:hypothetical protein
MILTEPFLFASATIGVICIGALAGRIIIAIMDWGHHPHH